MTDPWQTLGVPEGADPEVVRAAYRQLVREHHPDRHASGTAAQERAHARMAEINAAFRIVNDPDELERFRRLQRRRSSAQRSARPGEDGVHFSAADPRHGGAVEPAPGDPDFDYRARAWREFPTDTPRSVLTARERRRWKRRR
jgi:curved DNA-binding protein CbpA